MILPEKAEFLSRIENLYKEMCAQEKQWDAVFIIGKANQYYFTGTIEDGIFVLKKDGNYGYFVRRSFERAKMESKLDNLYQINSYKDVFAVIGDCAHVFMETEVATYGVVGRLKKYFTLSTINSVEKIVFNLRAVKSKYELDCILESGRQHKILLEDIVPSLLTEGISESEFTAALLKEMINLGYQGISRFSMFQAEIIGGQIGFGINSLYPTCFDGPAGMKGMYPAAPLIGEREQRLKKGDLVFVDLGYGVYGYHTDRTQLYMFKEKPNSETIRIHNKCLQIQKEAAKMLTPGAIPKEIYNKILNGLDEEFLEHFMGYKNAKVRFLGHGVGLQVDEYPVITGAFNEPLKENMVVALEPKRALENVGMLGSEDTYIVTENGGMCVTGGEKEIFVLD